MRTRSWTAARRKWWQDFLDGYKTQVGCELCGFQSERGGYFDIDHTDRSNGRNIPVTTLCRDLNPKRVDHMRLVLAELDRTQVLCVACHRGKTGGDLAGDWPRLE